ncbi:response regulator transcription factor [uncultured Paracoccus sp.]|uniref:response regulator transcription factor n=1 Tax=uncultured Paracoccus sp. TaxID=189685 RepID=UPI00260C0D2A|nr:response regulator transcription factor [uncultured Paracoccus sp.]
MAHILVVEDDPDIASLLERGLASAGHTTDRAECVESAMSLISSKPCDAAIIDMMLGEESGACLLTDLRNRGVRIPAIMLSALTRIEDRTEGLEAGAQDYVVKPFQLAELLARLEVQLRRAAPRPVMMTLGGLVYDPSNRLATGSGKPVVMSEREGDLLTLFLSSPGVVLTRGEIFDRIWAPQGGSTENVVDVYLGYLRRKLGNFLPYGLQLRTLRGRGFVLSLMEDDE